MSGRLELDLNVPRAQKLAAALAFLLFGLVAGMALREGLRGGRQGWDLWGRAAFNLLQGVVLWKVCLLVDAKTLVVEDGVLRVLPRVKRYGFLAAWLRDSLQLPVSRAALEWVGGTLQLQDPERGTSLRLGHGEAAKPVAAWLVAQGAPPPVGA